MCLQVTWSRPRTVPHFSLRANTPNRLMSIVIKSILKASKQHTNKLNKLWLDCFKFIAKSQLCFSSSCLIEPESQVEPKRVFYSQIFLFKQFLITKVALSEALNNFNEIKWYRQESECVCVDNCSVSFSSSLAARRTS
ncbi:hypothetical protein BpHYR1_024903 [Brachionus plicatilis]|uniref:Uncharacterized protein n=1 Tax=Brachionus plicatilis TaxID=10195 RepID=A0A3M7QAW5_BRAPC|nr:hypothetical protein BpHYR1_024903 [Brachionus plicatilis]